MLKISKNNGFYIINALDFYMLITRNQYIIA